MTAKNNEFIAKFKERCGAINCRELLGVDVSVPEQAAEAPELIQARCPHFVTAACDSLEEMLEDYYKKGTKTDSSCPFYILSEISDCYNTRNGV